MEKLLACMKFIGEDTIQRTQLTHRIALVNSFQLTEGMHILEIGCGQGDTTVALADAIGESGKIVAIDIATTNYGAPITLGEASETIMQSPLGSRIEFHYETDFLTFETTDTFDAVVLSHCSWYFTSPEQLAAYFQKMQSLTSRICFAEWDLDYTNMAQRPHFSAVNLLALYATFFQGEGNIQNLFHKKQIQSMLQQANFHIEKEQIVDATYLQDGAWEIDYAMELYEQFSQAPQRIQTLATSYYHLMQQKNETIPSLNSFVIIATR